jgi:tetratricopeptide (TPR) repeat protein
MTQPLFGQVDKGVGLLNSGEYDRAESVLRKAMKSEPNTTTQYYLGMSLLLQEKYGAALTVFNAAKSERAKASQSSRPAVPSEYQISIALARAYLGLKQYDRAWSNLESARIEDANSSEAFMYRGVYFLQQKKFKEAIADLDKAISLDPKNAYAYYYIGDAYFDTGKPDKTVEAFKMFLQLAPDAPEAPKVRARVTALC